MVAELLVAIATAAEPTPTSAPTATFTPTPTSTVPPRLAAPPAGIYGTTRPWQIRQLDVGTLPEPAATPVGIKSKLGDVKLKARSISDRPEERGGTFSAARAAPSKPYAADRISEVVAYEEAGQLVVYIVLGDAEGHETIDNGFVTLAIRATGTNYENRYLTRYDQQIYWERFPMKASDFTVATVGLGAFARERVLFRLPLVSRATVMPHPPWAKEWKVHVTVERPGKPDLSGSDEAYMK